MSTYDLCVSFTGLCWFAPKHPIEDARRRTTNRMSVVMVESKSPPTFPDPCGIHDHEQHHPVLVCPEECVANEPSARKPDACFTGRRRRRKWCVFFLEDQLVSLEGDDGEEDLLTVLYEEGSGQCPTKDDYFSFGWVVPLAKIEPGSQGLKMGCLGKKKVSRSVVTRVELGHGTIGTWRLAEDGGGIVLWEFKPPSTKGPHRQAVADSVMWHLPLESDRVQFVTVLFREPANRCVDQVFGGEVGKTLPIVLQPVDGRINAFVKNMPWKDIRNPPRASSLGPDNHFAHLYKLSRNLGAISVPHPLSRCPKVDPASGGSPFAKLKRSVGRSFGLRHQGRPSCPPGQGGAFG